jgi:hypothetical protein
MCRPRCKRGLVEGQFKGLHAMKLPLHKEPVKIPMEVRMLEQYGMDMKECPACKNKTLQLVKIFYPWKQADDG